MNKDNTQEHKGERRKEKINEIQKNSFPESYLRISEV